MTTLNPHIPSHAVITAQKQVNSEVCNLRVLGLSVAFMATVNFPMKSQCLGDVSCDSILTVVKFYNLLSRMVTLPPV